MKYGIRSQKRMMAITLSRLTFKAYTGLNQPSNPKELSFMISTNLKLLAEYLYPVGTGTRRPQRLLLFNGGVNQILASPYNSRM